MADVGISVKLDGIAAAVGDLGKLVKELDRTGAATKRASTSVDGFGGSFGKLRTIIAGVGIAAAARQFIQLADAMTNLNSRVRLVTGSIQQANVVQQKLLDIANRTRTDFESVGALYARLGRSADELGLSQERLLGFTETFSQALKISGATTAEAGSTILQLSQALASGYLRGAELNAVLEAGGRAAVALADGLGVPIGQLKRLGEEGKLTSEVVIRAIESQAGAIESEFTQMEVTVSDSFTVLRNSFAELVDRINDGTGTTKELSRQILDLSKMLKDPEFVSGVLKLAEGFAWLAKQAVWAAGEVGKALKGIQQAHSDLNDYLFGNIIGTSAERGLASAMKENEGSHAKSKRGIKGRVDTSHIGNFGTGNAFKFDPNAGGSDKAAAAKRKKELDAVLREEQDFADEQQRIYENNWSRANSMIEATLTPLEDYRMQLGDLQDLYAGGFITSAEDYNRVLQDMNVKLADSNNSVRAFEDAFLNAFDAIIEGGDDLGDALEGIGKQLAGDLLKANAVDPLMDWAKGGIGGLLGGGKKEEGGGVGALLGGEGGETASIFDTFLTGLKGIFGEGDKGFLAGLANLFNGEKGLIGQLGELFSGAWEMLSGLFMSFLSEYGLLQAWEMAERWALSLWEIAERWAIAAVEAAASFLGFERGGELTVTRPTLFVAGEKNKAERIRVSPLSGGERGASRGGGGGFASLAGEGGGSGTTNVQVFIPPTSVISGLTEGSFARKITRAVGRQRARTV